MGCGISGVVKVFSNFKPGKNHPIQYTGLGTIRADVLFKPPAILCLVSEAALLYGGLQGAQKTPGGGQVAFINSDFVRPNQDLQCLTIGHG